MATKEESNTLANWVKAANAWRKDPTDREKNADLDQALADLVKKEGPE